MPAVPAFCMDCGTPFNSGFFFDNATNVTLSGNVSGPCPKCGGMGRVPDGVFNFIGNTIEILSAPQRTISELLRLQAILRDARIKSESKEAVASRLSSELPTLLLLAKLLPENKSELYGFLSVVLAAIPFFLATPAKDAQGVTVNINQVIEQTFIQAGPPPSKVAKPSQSKKQGRNELCNCGSGVKYKKCCGALK